MTYQFTEAEMAYINNTPIEKRGQYFKGLENPLPRPEPTLLEKCKSVLLQILQDEEAGRVEDRLGFTAGIGLKASTIKSIEGVL